MTTETTISHVPSLELLMTLSVGVLVCVFVWVGGLESSLVIWSCLCVCDFAFAVLEHSITVGGFWSLFLLRTQV